jgi:hypothetical protein
VRGAPEVRRRSSPPRPGDAGATHRASSSFSPGGTLVSAAPSERARAPPPEGDVRAAAAIEPPPRCARSHAPPSVDLYDLHVATDCWNNNRVPRSRECRKRTRGVDKEHERDPSRPSRIVNTRGHSRMRSECGSMSARLAIPPSCPWPVVHGGCCARGLLCTGPAVHGACCAWGLLCMGPVVHGTGRLSMRSSCPPEGSRKGNREREPVPARSLPSERARAM